jgi:hypothetical protein
MVITILAAIFLVIIILIALFGYKLVGRQTMRSEEIPSGTCSICRKKIPLNELVTRQIADYKLMLFCRTCILNLYSDLGLKN